MWLWQAILTFNHLRKNEFLISVNVILLVKCQAAIKIQFLISWIYFLLVEIHISHFRNTILSSKKIAVQMSVLDINNWMGTF